MKPIFFAAFGLLACVNGNAAAAPLQAEVTNFAALTVSADQSARVVISNVSAFDDGKDPAPCKVNVKFFGPDGSLAEEVAALSMKPGESRSVSVSHPVRLLRASVGVEGSIEVSKACELKSRVEVFDVQTGTTFVSVAADSYVGHSECASSSAAASIGPGQDVTSAISPRRVSRSHRTRLIRASRHPEPVPNN